MKEKNKCKILLAFLISILIILIIITYPILDAALENFFEESEFIKINRVIDGDTVVVNGTSIRLLGINSPEKGEKYSGEAKNFLENLVLNKTVKLKFGEEKYDLYSRILGYIFVGDKNINLELVKSGFANFYFPSGKDIFYEEFYDAWQECIDANKNLCEKSTDSCADCIKLNEFNYKNQKVVFGNICDFDCNLADWQIKDEGRKVFIFPDFILKNKKQVSIIVGHRSDNKTHLYWDRDSYVWTKSGDTMFLRDDSGHLVLWKNY